MSSPAFSDRRHWIQSAVGITTAMMLGDAAADRWLSAAENDGVLLRPGAGSHDLFRVRVEMETEGNVRVPQSAVISKDKSKQVPVQSQATLDWEERVLVSTVEGIGHIAQRFYHQAESRGTVGNQKLNLTLRPEVRDLRVQHQDSQWLVYSPDRFLDGRELELLNVPAASLAIDALLPTRRISEGETYEIDSVVIAKWLSLAAVDSSTLVGELVSVTPEEAKLQLRGKVEGSVSGVPTSIELAAKLTFDRIEGCCTWLAIGLKENRQIGRAVPGFEVAAKIRMVRKPLAKPIRIAAPPLEELGGDVPAERLLVELNSPAVGYSVLMDRGWRIMSDTAGASMMRLVEQDTLVAQCNLHPLGKLAAGHQQTLEAFVRDSRESMGERFVETLQSAEEVNESGLRVMRVTIQGVVQSVPVQWIFIQYSDDNGRRLLATLTIGNDHLDAFAGADQQLSSSLRFLPLKDATQTVASEKRGSDGLR